MKQLLQKIKALFVKSETEKTTLQKTARASILVGAVALVAVVIYFAVIAPLFHSVTNYVPELFDGEYFDGRTIYMLPVIDRSEIKTVKIKNKVETYSLSAYSTENGDIFFAIDGSEDTVLSVESVAALIGEARVLVTNSPAGQDRVYERATETELRHYGLDMASEPSYFEVTLKDDSTYRVYIGNALTTSRGYYAMLDGRKNVVTNEDGTTSEYDIVYSLELTGAALKESASLVSTQIATPFGNSIAYASDFFLSRMDQNDEREVIVRVGRVPEGEEGVSAASQTYRMLYPESYIINEDAFGTSVLSSLASVKASSIVAYGEKIYTPEVYEKFNLDLDQTRLTENMDQNYAQVLIQSKSDSDASGEEIRDILYFSKKFKDLDGVEYYYVYSINYDVIGKVQAVLFPFVEWNITSFTNPYMYFEYFTSATSFDLVSRRNGIDLRFDISGKERSRRVDVATTGGEPLYQDTPSGRIPLSYVVSYKRIGSAIEFDEDGGFEIFRNLYYVLITRKLALDAVLDRNTTEIDLSKPAATVSVTSVQKDSPISYYQYGDKGKKGPQVHDEGGNILCHNVKVDTKTADGSIKTLEYAKAYYDETAGRFFLKARDTNDGYEKPTGYTSDTNGCVKVTLYLPEATSGEYLETIYDYEIYDIYDTYTDYDGNEVKQLNSTYMYVVPTITKNTYRLSSGGEKVVLDTDVSRAEKGVYIRTSTVDKLFSDAQRFLDGEKIDTMGVN